MADLDDDDIEYSVRACILLLFSLFLSMVVLSMVQALPSVLCP